ncbi:MAG: HEPN domain-containing protein [Nitrospirae bacterium]|nr:HEPN domain-containing protein [Nitrospirota bacterium]
MEKRVAVKIDKLLEKSERNLRAAERLSEMGEHDDSISRAYYAMYHAALALLLTRGASPTTHAGVLVLLSKEFVRTGRLEKRYLEMISEAKELRESGDYEPFFTGSAKESRTVLKEARLFVDRVKELLTERR